MRIQRDDSINKLEQSKTTERQVKEKVLKHRVTETEETRLNQRWLKLKMRSSNKEV